MANKLSRLMSRPVAVRQQAPIGGSGRKLKVIDATKPFVAPHARARDWRVVMIAPQQERRAIEGLTRHGWEVYSPQVTVWIKSARLRTETKVNRPLFPRYILVADVGTARGSIRDIPEVSYIIGQLSDTRVRELVARQEVGEFDNTKAPRAPFVSGDAVKVTEGPFAGFQGIAQKGDLERVTILLHILGHETPVEMSVSDVCLAVA